MPFDEQIKSELIAEFYQVDNNADGLIQPNELDTSLSSDDTILRVLPEILGFSP